MMKLLGNWKKTKTGKPPLIPPPMPDIVDALACLKDAEEALSRYVWNKSQVKDAIKTAEFFIGLAKEKLNDKTSKPS